MGMRACGWLWPSSRNKCVCDVPLHAFAIAAPPAQGRTSLSVRCLDVALPYAYEFLGCQAYPIFTPRALNCLIVVLQSLARCCGSEVSGPVESGKTGFVKGVGMLCGRNVMVTQCSQLTDPTVVLSIMEGCSQVSRGS